MKEFVKMLENALDVKIDPDSVFIRSDATPEVCPYIPVKISFNVYKQYDDEN